MRDRRLRYRTLALASTIALIVAACGGSGGSGPSASVAPDATEGGGDWTAEFVDGVLQPLPDGFPGEPIVLGVQGEAASDDGIYARQFQEAARAISPVPVNVVDRPDFGSGWEMMTFLNEQPGGPDGLTLQVLTYPGLVIDLLVTPIAADTGVSLTDFDTVMITEHVPWVLISKIDAPWGNSLEQMIEWAKDHPGELRSLVRGPDSGTTLAYQSFSDALGFTSDEIVGGSSSDIVTAVGAGEGDVALTIVGVAGPVIEAGRAVVLGCTGDVSPCAGFDNAVSLSSLTGEVDPWGANRALAINKDAPALHREWMEAFVRAVVDSDEFTEARQAVPGYQGSDGDNDEALELNQTAYDVAYEILEARGLLDPTVQAP